MSAAGGLYPAAVWLVARGLCSSEVRFRPGSVRGSGGPPADGQITSPLPRRPSHCTGAAVPPAPRALYRRHCGAVAIMAPSVAEMSCRRRAVAPDGATFVASDVRRATNVAKLKAVTARRLSLAPSSGAVYGCFRSPYRVWTSCVRTQRSVR